MLTLPTVKSNKTNTFFETEYEIFFLTVFPVFCTKSRFIEAF